MKAECEVLSAEFAPLLSPQEESHNIIQNPGPVLEGFVQRSAFIIRRSLFIGAR
jgi:hypothetical protein